MQMQENTEEVKSAMVEINPDDPENMEYLLCYITNDEEIQSFELVTGRQNAYDMIVDLAESDVDLYHSFMVSSKTTLRKRISFARFLLSIHDGLIKVDRNEIDFKIEDHVDRDEVEF